MPNLHLPSKISRPKSSSGRENPRSNLPTVPRSASTSLDSAAGLGSEPGSKWKGKGRALDDEEWRLGSDPFASQNHHRLGSQMHRAAPARANGSSNPLTTEPRQRSITMPESASFFLRKRNQFFRRPTSRDKTSTAPPIIVTDPVLHIRLRKSIEEVEDEEDIELGRLRDAAARSIGIGSPSSLEDEPPPQPNLDLPDRKPQRSGRGSAKDTNTDSTERTQSVKFSQTPHPSRQDGLLANSNVLVIPPFPCTLSSLTPSVRTTSAISKYSPPPAIATLLTAKKSSPKHWKSRHLVLSSAPQLSSSGDSDMESIPYIHFLHLFKGSFPDDKEIDRIQIIDSGHISVPDDRTEIAGRQCVLQIMGYDAKLRKRDAKGGIILGTEATWLFQCPDSQMMQKWVLSVKTAIDGSTDTDNIPPKKIEQPPHNRSQPRRRSMLPPLQIPSTKGHTVNIVARGESVSQNGFPASPSSVKPSPSAASAIQTFRGLFSAGSRTSALTPSPSVHRSVTTSTEMDENEMSFEMVTAPEAIDEIDASSSVFPLPSSGGFAPFATPTPRTSIEPERVSSVDTEPSFISPVPDSPDRSLTSSPAHLLIGVPITPIDERPSIEFSSLPNMVHDEKRGRGPINPRLSAISPRLSEGQRDKEYARFLSSPSYGGATGTGRPTSPSSILSLPPPPRSRRATTSGGFSHRPISPVPQPLSVGRPLSSTLVIDRPASSPLEHKRSSLLRHSYDGASDPTTPQDDFSDPVHETSSFRNLPIGSSSFGAANASRENLREGSSGRSRTRRNSSASSGIQISHDPSTLERSNSASSKRRRRETRIENLPKIQPPPLVPPPDIPRTPIHSNGPDSEGAPKDSLLSSPIKIHSRFEDSTPPTRTSSVRRFSVAPSSQSVSSRNSIMTSKTHEANNDTTNHYGSPWSLSAPSPYHHPFASSAHSFTHDTSQLPPSREPEPSPTQSEFSRRSQRHSTIPPRPAPQSSLPPTPDEVITTPGGRRNSETSGFRSQLDGLSTIPASPLVQNGRGFLTGPALPAPNEPLPQPHLALLQEDRSKPPLSGSPFRHRSRRVSAPTKTPNNPTTTFSPPPPALITSHNDHENSATTTEHAFRRAARRLTVDLNATPSSPLNPVINVSNIPRSISQSTVTAIRPHPRGRLSMTPSVDDAGEDQIFNRTHTSSPAKHHAPPRQFLDFSSVREASPTHQGSFDSSDRKRYDLSIDIDPLGD